MTNETKFDDLGGRLAYIILWSGIDKKKFTKECGISENQIYNYLNGSSEPGTKFYRGLKSKYPSVSIDWLITGDGEPFIDRSDGHPENVLDLQHERIFKQFADKECAIEIDQALVALERASQKEFYKLAGIIQDRVEKQVKYRVDRRSGVERRQSDEPPPDEDRRSGKDRRKAVGEN